MVGINEMTDAALEAIIANGNVGLDAYVCAADELAFRSRHPEYSVK